MALPRPGHHPQARPWDQPMVVGLAEGFRQAIAAQEAVAIFELQLALGSVGDHLQVFMEELADEARAKTAAGETLSPNAIFQMQRYRALQAMVFQQMDSFGDVFAESVETNVLASARRGVDHSGQMIQFAQAEFDPTIRVTPVDVNIRALQNIVALESGGFTVYNHLLAQQGIQDGGRPLAEMLAAGITAGENPREVARRMREFFEDRVLKRAELIARDQMNRAARLGTQQGYIQSGVVNGFRRLAAKNERTCMACLALDGTEYELETFMEVHPQDRCTMVPILDGYPPVKFQTGEEWFNSLDEDTQKRMLGPGKFDLWKDRNFPFSEFATVDTTDPVWGPKTRPTTLTDLRAFFPDPASTAQKAGDWIGGEPPGDWPTPDEFASAGRQSLGNSGQQESWFVEGPDGNRYFMKDNQSYGATVEQLNSMLAHQAGEDWGSMFATTRILELDDDPIVISAFLDNALTLSEIGLEGTADILDYHVDNTDQLQRMSLWDWMTGQRDRHRGNVMADLSTNDIFLIDNAGSLGGHWAGYMSAADTGYQNFELPYLLQANFDPNRVSASLIATFQGIAQQVMQEPFAVELLTELADTMEANLTLMSDSIKPEVHNAFTHQQAVDMLEGMAQRVDVLREIAELYEDDGELDLELFQIHERDISQGSGP